MDLLDYTTNDDIRAVLGVSDNELSDETLSLEVYSSNLSMELEDIGTTLATQYEVVRAKLEASRTSNETRFFTATRMFAVYATANQLGSSLPMFSPKDISDSKTAVGRFSDSPYKETLKRVSEGYESNRARLMRSYVAMGSSVTMTSRVFMSVSQPSTDPVVE